MTKPAENLTIKIEKFDDDLNGVAFRGGKKFVVQKVLPDEEVLCDERRKSGNTVLCTLKEVLVKSPSRVNPPCKYYDLCGGCALLHTSHRNQLMIKTALVRRKFSALNYFDVSDTVGFSDENSRNKTHVVFSSKNGEVSAGFFNADTHEVVDVEKCLLHGEWYETLRKILIEFAKKEKLSVYNPRTGRGVLRFAAARKIGNAIMLTLVVTKEVSADFSYLSKMLENKFSEAAVFLNVNNEKTNAVFSDKFIHVAGKKTLCGEMLGVKFELSPNSFYQVNDEIAKTIYEKVLSEIEKSKPEKVIDLFSGIGITSVLFAKNGYDVTSVEIAKSSVENAKNTARQNGVFNKIDARLGDANEIIRRLDFNNGVVFVDPPRAGLQSVAHSLACAKPEKIIYLSCSLKTLVEDLKILKKGGYEISSVTPYDMFPASKHVETLVVLSKRKEGKGENDYENRKR